MVNNNLDFDALDNANVYDDEHKKIGSIGQVYLDDDTQQPKFVTVNVGLFGARETFIPVESANRTEDGITVPFSKDFIKDAPNVDVDGHLTPDEERQLFDYYSLNYDDRSGRSAGGVRDDAGRRDDRDDAGRRGERDGDLAAGGVGGGLGRDDDRGAGLGRDDAALRDRGAGLGRDDDAALRDGDRGAGLGRDDADRAAADGRGREAGLDDEGSLVAHEERLHVGTEQHEAGRARLRKRVRTEHQNVEVPVQREELVVEREEIDPNSAEARNAGGIDAQETEEVVTLREERPVVDKETVATERVNVGKRTVQDTETVSGDVRREEIEVDDEENGPDRRR
ncbi:PRC and DUF2382 domain-containing protein [Rothia sp. AR01]|uniref:PRC and DUF2382 domain-containing protein n=1 Tax=Rothia santali TaxID=2949643 RepID=A0A9X2HEW9_9MICC|nr:PRC and DUF2382 domain-containing protein [Rothia santali]MCP3425989.1 PRC and DUF2382 domain-containing protein [Rothia santali]